MQIRSLLIYIDKVGPVGLSKQLQFRLDEMNKSRTHRLNRPYISYLSYQMKYMIRAYIHVDLS